MLKVGVIGLGIGQAHIQQYRELEDVEIAAVADSNRERLDAFTAENTVRTYESYEALLDDAGDLDAVSICLPNFLHADAAIKAFEAGLHVLCEKPLAHTLAEGQRIAEAAKKSGKKFMMNLHQRFTPGATYIRSMLDAGELGDVYYSFSSYLRQPGGIPSGVGGWFYRKQQAGGGALLDNGVHLIDQQWYLMGCPKPVMAMGQIHAKFGPTLMGEHFDVDDFASGMVRFENGATLTFDNAWAALVESPTHLVRVLGTKMGATAQPFKIMAYKEGECIDVTPESVKTENPVAHFVRCIKEDATPVVTMDQAVTMLKILDALYQSAQLGTAVEIK